MRNRDGSKTWLLIEAKYQNGKSSTASENQCPPNDQLAREYDNLKILSEQKRINQFAVIYLTADFSCPTEDLKASSEEYEQSVMKDPDLLALLERLIDILEENAKHDIDIVRDLKEFLLYTGVDSIQEIKV